MAQAPRSPDLTTITAPGGARFTVAKAYAPQFQNLVNSIEAQGYQIDPGTSGGYNPRNIRGTNTPSEHSFGRAIDINWNANPPGSTNFGIPADVAHKAAAEAGMTWGGDWSGKTKDAMHFEIKQHPTDPSQNAVLTVSDPNNSQATGFGLPTVAATDPNHPVNQAEVQPPATNAPQQQQQTVVPPLPSAALFNPPTLGQGQATGTTLADVVANATRAYNKTTQIGG